MRTFVVAMLLSACSASAPATSDIPDDPARQAPHQPGGMVALGETATLGTVRITPLRVAEDSRCPLDVACAWPGRILLAVRIDVDGQTSEALLDTIVPLERDGVVLSIADVRPVRTRVHSDAPMRYTFRFARAPARAAVR